MAKTKKKKQNKKMRYTKDQVLQAVRKSRGIMSNVAKTLSKIDGNECDWHVAKRHVEKWDQTRNSFLSQCEKMTDRAEKSLDRAVSKGQPWAVSLVLKSQRAKSRGWQEKQEVEINANVEHRQMIVYPEELGILNAEAVVDAAKEMGGDDVVETANAALES